MQPNKLDFWSKHIKAWKTTGSSQRQYCQQAKLNLYTFQYWTKRLKSLTSAKQSFVQLDLKPIVSVSPTFELTVSKYRVEIKADFCPEELKRLIQCLESL